MDKEEIIAMAEEGEFDDLYDKKKDYVGYEELIEAGYVLDEKGRIEVKKFSDEQKEKMKKLSVLGIDYVLSGRGKFDGWKSNLQKCVRRCDVIGALKSVEETCELGGPFLSNIINRLCKVMVSEDIGPAEPWIAKECYEFLLYYEKRKDLWKSTIKTGIIEGAKNIVFDNDISFKHRLLLITQKLASCRKSRLCDNVLHAHKTSSIKDKKFEEIFNYFKESVEEKEIDKSIKYLRMLYSFEGNMGKEQLKNYQQAVKSMPKFAQKLLLRKKNLVFDVWRFLIEKSKEADKRLFDINCYLLGIYLMAGDEGVLEIMNCLLNLLFFYEDRLDLEESEVCKLRTIKCSWEALKNKDIWIQSVSYDKHTKIGRELGRDKLFFWLYCAKLSNKNPLLEEYDKRYYNQCIRRTCMED